jgi:putative membrane protein
VSDLNDPRVLFAAERTMLAWVRTASGMMAMGFLIDRGAIMTSGPAYASGFALAIGLGFVLGGVLLCVLSAVQYRRSIASLRPVEIPAHYWTNLALFTSAFVGVLGLALAVYLSAARTA